MSGLFDVLTKVEPLRRGIRATGRDGDDDDDH